MVELNALVQRYLAKSAAEGAMKGTSLGQGRWVLLTYIVANSPLQGSKQCDLREEDRLVIWDYHVIFLYSWDNKTCLVYDLDSELPFPTFFHKYVTETFRTDQVLKSDFHRLPPPPYPAICTPTSTHNLDEYINMDLGVGPGQVFNLTDFVQRFYKINK
ncbi:protein N-terminal glutamine amidohydrolase-like [Trichoplusia ni]|uniref:Protein N-terminal glutamine amidohydrolase n=1 Tax=Trichoplusia ni TaxID=7111 RepID=A0A7E5WRA5_TRINI|nr:protein N-terminal glutamine amidohydrolase-like [Trichoplusia ni]